MNLGANDMMSLPAEAAWITNYQGIIDATHIKWPLAKIYISKPWTRNHDADAITVAGRIDTLIAANSGFCFAADDESGWLKGADNGAAMTLDGVHYSTAGDTEKINQMVTVLGY